MTKARTRIREGFVSKIAFEIVVGEACNARKLHLANREKIDFLDKLQKE